MTNDKWKMIRLRPGFILTLLGLCLGPLVLLGVFTYFNGLAAAESAFIRDLENELDKFDAGLSRRLEKYEDEFVALGGSEALCEYVCPRQNQSDAGADDALATNLKINLASLLNNRSHFASFSFFDQNKKPVFFAERGVGEQATQGLIFRNKDFLPGQPLPDERIWGLRTREVVRSPISTTPAGAILRLTIPVFHQEAGSDVLLGALVADLKVDSLLSDAAAESGLDESAEMNSGSHRVVVVDRTGRILYHPNRTLIHQPVNDSMPHFRSVASRMLAGEAGWQSFISSTGQEVWAAFDALPALDAIAAVQGNYSQAVADARRLGLTGLIYSVLIGMAAAILLALYFHRRTRGIERVSEGVAAIAKGKLDHRIELRSSDDNRLLADNVNLMTDRLRQQIARETEAQQFQSFVKLSAMLTHDLKNAIEALSLIVGNMERHFENEEFRIDAMKSLNLATQNLRALVARLSNPVTTLSGEHQRPQMANLIPMLKRVIALTAEPVRGIHQIEAKLPESLFALVDEERIGKVMENLVINALEAMAGKSGTLTIEAGKTAEGKAFFSVTDTGMGMTRDFLEKRLYRPFATTKKKGVGLGLYTCREVVRAHGGSIDVESRESAGTTFRVVLPSTPLARPELEAVR
ncbi:MAG: ATP-binding protein [Pyrinomonadaceae bacterium]